MDRLSITQENEMANFTVTVGRLMARQVRDYLDSCKFREMDIDYIESFGFFQRDFTIKGSIEDVIEVRRTLAEWARQQDLNK